MSYYIEETRRSKGRKRRNSDKDPNRGNRKWEEELEILRNRYAEQKTQKVTDRKKEE